MLLSTSTVRFTREEVAQLLSVPPAIVDAMTESGALTAFERGGEILIASTQVEGLLRDALLRLYRAEARMSHEHAIDIPAHEPVFDEPHPVREEHVVADAGATVPDFHADASLITHSISEFEAAVPPDYEAPSEPERPDLRIAPRYVPRRQLGGTFQQVKFTVLQLSTTGLRIRHDEPLRPGDEARLTFAILKPARSFVIRARVVWTSIAQRGEGASFCVSGLTVLDREDQLRAAIDVLREARELQVETQMRTVRRSAPASPSALTGMSDDDVAAIIRTLKRFSSDPVEASRWYARARFSIANEDVRRAAPRRARDREEVLGVWEYLDRRLDIAAVAKVVAWIRQTRAAAAVASA